ncbi:MAG: ABC transporter permease [Planctomycetota bacterium]
MSDTQNSSPAAATETLSGGPPRASLIKRIASAQEAGLVLVIVIMMTALTIFGGTKNAPVMDRETGMVQRDANGDPVRREVSRFLEPDNLVLLANNASYIAIMAVGMTAIIILAGIDLSVGSTYALAALLGAMLFRWIDQAGPEFLQGWMIVPVAFIACCVIGGIAGLANGAMIVGFRVHPFIITLGTMAIYRGLVFVFSGGQSISGFPDDLQGFMKTEIQIGQVAVNPVPMLIMIAVALAGMFLLSRTVVGRQVYAIGGNETAARYAGIPVGRVKILCFTAVGLLAGLSACIYAGYYGAAEPNAGNAYELRVIAAAVIGGASLSGGRGSALGAVLGAIIIELINNGMIILGIDQSYNQIVMGAAIVIAVVIDQTKGRFVRTGA